VTSMSFSSLGRFLTTGVRRDPTSCVGSLLKPFAALVALGIVWVTTVQIVQIYSMTIVFLGLMLALVFLTTGATANSSGDRVPGGDLFLAAASLGISAYFWFHNERIVTRITLLDELTSWDILCGSGLLLVTLEATRRTVGPGLTSIVLVFLAYNLWGDVLPGVLGHGPIGYLHFLDMLAFTTDGIFGAPIRVALTYVFLFSLFGTFLARAGGGEFFFDAAAAVSGKSPGGPAKIAVASSGLYGTISGSPTADVVTTGSITIPMMKKLGYSSAAAGGIEVAASTGGSVLPPVMGSAAFIMTEFTGIRYTDIAVAAILPAFLYYFCLYLQVHLHSLKQGITGLEDVPAFGDTMRRGGMFLVPLVALVAALLIGYSPNFVAAFGTLAVIAVAMCRRETRFGLKGLYEILAESTLRVVPVVAACAAAGLVVGGLSIDRPRREGCRPDLSDRRFGLVPDAARRGGRHAGARHGHAHAERLHSGRGAGRARTDEARRLADGVAPLSRLLREPVRHDAADRGRSVRGGPDRARSSARDRPRRGSNVDDRVRRSVRVRLQQRRPALGLARPDRAGLRGGDCGGRLPLSRGRGLLEAAAGHRAPDLLPLRRCRPDGAVVSDPDGLRPCGRNWCVVGAAGGEDRSRRLTTQRIFAMPIAVVPSIGIVSTTRGKSHALD